MSLYSALTQVLAPFAAKIKGIQTGYDGTEYTSPGEAVREQINDLHVLIGDTPGTAIQASAVAYNNSNVAAELTNVNGRLVGQEVGHGAINFGTLVANSYVHENDGLFGYYANWSRTDYIDIRGYSQMKLQYSAQSAYNAFYDEQKGFIGAFTVKASETIIPIPEGCAYMALSNMTSDMSTLEGTFITKNALGISDTKSDTYSLTGKTNLLNGLTWTNNYSIGADGSIGENKGFRYSALIPVADGYYTLSYVPTGQNRNTRIHGYDTNGNWVKQIDVSGAGSGTDLINFLFYVSGVSSIRISTGTEVYTKLMYLCKGENLSDETERIKSSIRWKEIRMLSGYITTNNGTAYITDFSVNTSNPNARYAIVDCSEGDVFTINARGASAPRAFAFIDADGKILEMAEASTTISDIFIAPSTAVKLIINDFSTTLQSYKSVEPVRGYDKLDSVQKVTPIPFSAKNWVCRLGWATNRIGSGVPVYQTIESYKLAYQNDCRIMLADVRMTSDNVFVCLHDAALDGYVRNTDGSKLAAEEAAQLVSDLTLSQLNAYDWGIVAGKMYAGTKVLTVEEFLRFCAYTGCIAILEMKIQFDQSKIKALAKLVNKFGMGGRVVIFDNVIDYNTNKSYWISAFPLAEVVLNDVSVERFPTAKTLTEELIAAHIPTSISTGFVALSDSLIDEYNEIGGTVYYTEVKSEAEYETLKASGHLDYCRYIACSYFNINKKLSEEFLI